eukprot:scaffold38130_cov63-Attheya_sp.AAC.1
MSNHVVIAGATLLVVLVTICCFTDCGKAMSEMADAYNSAYTYDDDDDDEDGAEENDDTDKAKTE